MPRFEGPILDELALETINQMSTIHTLAADIAARVPDMARDSAVNNSGLIERLMKSHLEKMIDEIESERRKWPRRVMATNGRTVRIIYEMGL